MKLPVKYRDIPIHDRRVVRTAYIEKQEGLCHHCRSSLAGLPPKSIRQIQVTSSLFPLTFFNYPVHLHHSHASGLTIGAVHAYCNAVLWQYHGE